MSELNHIEPSHISRLNGYDLATLLRLLLYAEAKHRPAAIVHVPLQINVPDGGEDGRWKGDIDPSEYIPNKFTVYQIKAQDLAPSECKAELLVHSKRTRQKITTNRQKRTSTQKQILKSSIEEVLKAQGSYVFFCGHGYVQKDIKKRLKKAQEALNGDPRCSNRAVLSFLDANKIAAWSNKHASAVAHVSKCCQMATAGAFRTWKDWSREVIFNCQFHSTAELEKAIEILRAHLVKGGNVARIAGYSGLGKTRLAFEALRPPDDILLVSQAMLSGTTIYLDMERSGERVLALVNDLETAGMTGTVVVDNCKRSNHQKLESILQRSDCRLSLLTMDYVPESSRPGTVQVNLEPAMMQSVIPKMLKDVPQGKRLTENQLLHVSSLAHGFPQIATLLAEAGDALDWARLDETKLASRILWGRDLPNDAAKRVIATLSLFTHVGFEGQRKAQKAFVREVLCEHLRLSEHDFDELIRPFRHRRIIQTAGDFIMVTPPPLAVALAAEWWEVANADELKIYIPQIENNGMTKYFCDRVQQLHFSQNAANLAVQLCGDAGPLSDAEVLNSEVGSQLFRAMVELNPTAAIDCASRVFGIKDLNELRQIQTGRRHLVWALEKLCWSREHFLKAAALLLNFAAAENETWSNNASGQFKQLFQLQLAGTQMPGIERFPVIEDGLASGVQEKRRLCVEALGVALKKDFFSRTSGVEVRGSGLPQEDWAPKTYGEIFKYWTSSFRLLKKVILEKSAESELAKKVLGSHLRGILIPPILQKLEADFKEIAESENHYWPEALKSIQDIFEYDSAQQTPESISRLNTWLTWLSPRDLKLRLELFVTNAPHQNAKGPDGSYIDVAAQNATKLADELLQLGTDLKPFLDNLQKGGQQQSWAFGHRLGQTSLNQRIFIRDCIDSLKRLPTNVRNPSLLAGFLGGLSDRIIVEETLAMVAEDGQIAELIVALTRMSNPHVQGVRRVVDLAIQGRFPPELIRQFAYGSVLDKLAPEEIVNVFSPLVEQVEGSRGAVFEIVSMYVLYSDSRWRGCRDFIRKLLLMPAFAGAMNSSMDGHHWQEAVIKLLKEQRDEELAIGATRQILESQKNREVRYEVEVYHRPVLAVILSEYPNSCWPLVGAEILSPHGLLFRMLLGRHGFNDRESSVLWNVPLEILVRWVRENKMALPHILSIVALYTVDDEGEYHWHPSVLAMLDEKIDDPCVGAISSNMFSFGWSGSKVPYLEKRIRLMRSILDHPNAGVRKMATDLIKAFEEDIQREKKRDEEISAGIM